MKKVLWFFLAVLFLIPAGLKFKDNCSLNEQVEQARQMAKAAEQKMSSFEQIYKAVSMAELKLVSSYKAEKKLMVRSADDPLTSIKVDGRKYEGQWNLVDVENDELSDFVAEIADSVISIFKKDGSSMVLLQKLMIDFSNVVPLTEFTDGVQSSFGDYGGALVTDLGFQSGQNVLPASNVGFGIYKDNFDVVYLLTNLFQNCQYRLVRTDAQ